MWKEIKFLLSFLFFHDFKIKIPFSGLPLVYKVLWLFFGTKAFKIKVQVLKKFNIVFLQ